MFHSTGTSPKGRRKLTFIEKRDKLPLTGKSIFVDVKETGQCRLIREDFKRLGAVQLGLIIFLILKKCTRKDKIISMGKFKECEEITLLN